MCDTSMICSKEDFLLTDKPSGYACLDCSKPVDVTAYEPKPGHWYWRKYKKCTWCRNRKYTKSEPYVYFAWFSADKLLKIGYSTQVNSRIPIILSTKYKKVYGKFPSIRPVVIHREFGWSQVDEAFCQSVAQLSGYTAWEHSNSTRLSEWLQLVEEDDPWEVVHIVTRARQALIVLT